MAQVKKLQSGGAAQLSTPQTLTYKGLTFDKGELLNKYKDYLKTVSQNNVTGFQQGDQYKDIDEHLNNRIANLTNSTNVEENKEFTTAPQEINGVTGLNTFLNSGDKSKSKNFENQAFYSFMDKVSEGAKTTQPTQTAAKNYHAFLSPEEDIAKNEFAGSKSSFKTVWNNPDLYNETKKIGTLKTSLLRQIGKLKAVDFNSDENDLQGIDKDTFNQLKSSKRLDEIEKTLQGDVDKNTLIGIAGQLGQADIISKLLHVEPVVLTPEQQQLAAEQHALHTSNLAQHKIADETRAKNVLIKEQNRLGGLENIKRRAVAKTKFDAMMAKSKLDAENKLRAGTSGGASFLKGTGPNGEYSTADKLDALSLTGDIASFAGTYPALVGGLTSTVATLGSDILRGHGVGETLGNVGMNLGFTALALVPGLASIKAGSKAAKAVHALKIVDKAAEGAEKTLKVLKPLKVLTEAQKAEKIAALAVLKEIEVIKTASTASKTSKVLGATSKIVDNIPGSQVIKRLVEKAPKVFTGKNAGKLATGIRYGGAAAGLVSGYEGIKDVGTKVISGNAGDVNLNDARNLIYGTMAARGIGRRIQKGAAYEKVQGAQTQTAGSEVSLKGVDSKLTGVIPEKITLAKGQKPQEKINEIFDSKITPKKEALAKLDETKDKKAFDDLKAEIELLETSKKSAKLKAVSKLKNLVGIGKTKDKFEKDGWKLKTAPTDGSIHSTFYQQKMINKVNEPEIKFKKELAEMRKVTDKKLGTLNKLTNRSKSINVSKQKSIDRVRYKKLAEAKKSAKIGKKAEGGIMKFQTPASPIYGGNKVDLSIKAKNPNRLHYGKIDTSGNDWRFGKEGKYSDEYTNTIGGLTEDWFNTNKGSIQKAIDASGSKYQLGTLQQLKSGATDYKPGVLHDIFKTKPVIAQTAPPAIVPPVVPVIKAPTPVITPVRNPTVDKKVAKPKGKFDTQPLAEGAKYLMALQANKKNAQLLQTTPALKSMMQAYKPVVTDFASENMYKQSGLNTQNLANKQARGTSDINIANAAQQDAQAKQEEFRQKGASANTEMYNKTLMDSIDTSNKVKEYNLGVGDSNIAEIRNVNLANGQVNAQRNLADTEAHRQMIDAGQTMLRQRNEVEANNKRLDDSNIARKTYQTKYEDMSTRMKADEESGHLQDAGYQTYAGRYKALHPNETPSEAILKAGWQQDASYDPYVKNFQKKWENEQKGLDIYKTAYQDAQEQRAINPHEIQIPKLNFNWSKKAIYADGGKLTNAQKVQLENLKLAAKARENTAKRKDKDSESHSKGVSKVLNNLGKAHDKLMTKITSKK